MPDITPAQVLAIIAAIVGAATAFGLDLSTGQQQAIMGLAGALVVMLPASDAHIRRSRNQREAKIMAAAQYSVAEGES